MEDALATVDAIADRTFAEWKVPGVVYGVIVGGALRHSRGLGTIRVGEDATPDADSVFRIASMTKSFTAAAILSLRDEGRLRLDDPIADHLPRLAGLRGPTTDSPPITIRHLLTMTAGFPTDDPWGDRQQGLDTDAFLDLVARGLTFAWAPGTRFEYSNLGYGILGRLVTAVAGREYREVVRERLLEPLGMPSTGYLEAEVAPERLARGYVWRDGTFLDEPMDGYGALASMGGVFTTVRDLVTWVNGFIDAFPPRDEPGMAHPLRRASRREMQQPMVPIDPGVTFRTADAHPELDTGAYGFGLFVNDHLRWGRIVGHSGGYPGFGSNMRWHPPSGLGVIALANGRYANSAALAGEMLIALLEAEAAPSRRVAAAPPTLAARAAVETLLERWDDALAGRLFAMNVELDEPLRRRRAAIEKLRDTHGRLTPDPAEPPVANSPFDLAWWLRGERGGRVKVELLLTPEVPPLVQAMDLTSVPEPPAELRAAAERICAALAMADDRAPVWPAELALAGGVDAAELARAMRAAEARFGAVHLGPVLAGDGTRTATFRLECSRGRLELQLERDPATGQFTKVRLRPVRLAAAAFD
ncbi:MAG TPA: serine hydrolase domain-containing protein [Candidatus Acidoferrales bacterium]|nr:serine hydrolase domain-containing protein [Candidatus Acidoferrales bacterium]